jgi:phosphotriesterase-related protein
VIQTVTGEIEPDQLGFVLPHEHVFSDAYEITMNSQLILSDGRVAREELGVYRAAGGRTLVDQTVNGLNPEPEALREVARDVGLTIIAGTGFYWEKFYPPWLHDTTERDITALLVRDLTEGFNGTDVRAGIIGEIGTHHRGMTPTERRVYRAAAAAQREVGVPIATHALFTRIGMEQARFLEAAGADLDHVVIGHVDTTPDVDYHDELARTGVWIAYDAIGQLDKQTDEHRADAVVELVARGHARRILLSSDVGKRGALRYYGGQGYDHVIRNFLPLLRARGLGEDVIDLLTRDNPCQLFTF